MRALLLADVTQQAIGGLIARRALVEIVDLLVLGRLPRGEQAVDGRHARLQSHPRRELDRALVGDGDAELVHPRLEALAVTALGGGHAAQDVALALGHPPADELIDTTRFDFATPCFEQAVANLVAHRVDSSPTADSKESSGTAGCGSVARTVSICLPAGRRRTGRSGLGSRGLKRRCQSPTSPSRQAT